jgi:hypothetical protein
MGRTLAFVFLVLREIDGSVGTANSPAGNNFPRENKIWRDLLLSVYFAHSVVEIINKTSGVPVFIHAVRIHLRYLRSFISV